MTREEAIKWVKFVHDVLYEDKNERIREALNMAISALSVLDQIKWERDAALATLEEHGIGLGQIAEPQLDVYAQEYKAYRDKHPYGTDKVTEPSDLISRADLLKKAEKANITKYSTNSVNVISADVVTVENIKKAPSVSAERVIRPHHDSPCLGGRRSHG